MAIGLVNNDFVFHGISLASPSNDAQWISLWGKFGH